ncbi:TetR family transcriptional regulator [uncultured Desulfosarcina sp.]|uniref:TetR/AcrR family transcriptional regulator n=1 Tax=uncultured Desulfosarcina sp. TaxID=218289 RepID=UPI0029C771C5|nr:TetR family transcriptional regulator [uncultured Desulfosarcina sp.]
MGWERARTEEQKEQRIAAILDATARLYATQPFEKITLVSIAKAAKFTRSNLYKYFNSKEEIFFEFLKQDVIRWRKDLVTTLGKKKRYTVRQFAAAWLDVHRRHERMQDLISILYDFLEKNASIDRMVEFKRLVNDEYTIVTSLLCNLFSALSPQKAVRFLNMQLAASIGLYRMTNLSAAQKEVLAYPEFKHLKVDYTVYYQECVEYLLKGLLG